MIEFTVYGCPFGKERPRVTRYATYTPQKTKDYEKLVQDCYFAQSVKQGVKMALGAVLIEIRAFYQIPKQMPKKQQMAALNGKRPTKKPDYDNIGKIITDALNKIAYIDDAYVVDAHIMKFYSDNPRVEIKIEEI